MMRSEIEMHAAWAALRFERTALQTTKGIPIRILSIGTHNHNQGPDFLNAEVELAGIRMNGHVELHLRSQDWNLHGHQHDSNYNPVILHVVLESSNQPILREDQTQIPELCLANRMIGPGIIKNQKVLPCGRIAHNYLPNDSGTWLEALGMQRIQAKSIRLKESLKENQYDWSQDLWRAIAQTMGGPINAESFVELTQIANWRLVRKYTFSEEALESIIFGAAGLLTGRPLDDYHHSLALQWKFLQKKHKIQQKHLNFKQHRMRPSGMPIARLAQLVKLAQAFSPICQLLEPEMMRHFIDLKISGNPYWKGKLQFGNRSGNGKFELGLDLRTRIIVNALVPMGIVYRQMHEVEGQADDAFDLLKALPAESNHITKKFELIGLKAQNALQSQGIIELYKSYCQKSQCFQCEIGRQILIVAPSQRECSNHIELDATELSEGS